MSKAKQKVINSFSYHFQDSIYLKYEVSKSGKIKILNKFSYFSDRALKLCESQIESLKGLLADENKGKTFEVSFKFDIPKEFKSFPDLNIQTKHPQLKFCKSYSKKAQLACFQYINFLVEKELKHKHNLKEELSINIYFVNGKIKAITPDIVPIKTYWNDYIYESYNKHLDSFIDPNQQLDDESFVSNIILKGKTSYGKKLKKYYLKRIEYLKKFKTKEPYLKAVLKFANDYYETAEAQKVYILAKLKELNLDTFKSFTIEDRYYNVDSIKNYNLNFDLDYDDVLLIDKVESLPVYHNCNPDADNNELKICLQKGITEHVVNNFKYPEEARTNNIKGRVYVNFVIEKDGTIDNIKILLGVDPILDLECIRVVAEIPNCDQPAKKRNIPVRMSFTLPINTRFK